MATTVMRVQFNLFVNKDTNTSFSFEHLVTSEDDARELGVADQAILAAYLDGYGSEPYDSE